MKKQIVYKVVDINLRSVVIGKGNSIGHESLAVQYLENQWVESKNKHAPLMAFSNLDSAIEFARRESYAHYIYKCEAIISKKRWGWVNNVLYVLSLKTQKKKISHFIQYGDLPENTIFCDSVRLIEVKYSK